MTPQASPPAGQRTEHRIHRLPLHGFSRPVAAHDLHRRRTARRQSFTDGFGFDGSSIRGWQAINESDMLLVPVADTAHIDPFLAAPDAGDHLRHQGPDHQKAILAATRVQSRKGRRTISRPSKIGDRAMFGPEMEFFVFDNVWYDQDVNSGFLPRRFGRRHLEPRQAGPDQSRLPGRSRKAISPRRRWTR